jgi:hypothetical protein
MANRRRVTVLAGALSLPRCIRSLLYPLVSCMS